MTGSVAAYKAPVVARRLMARGASVRAVMTASAQRFVGVSTLAGLTGRRVEIDAFDVPGELHVEMAGWSDLVVVAPATADVLARAASGRASDLVSAILLCARPPILVAPAMHPSMWDNPLVSENARRLASLGWTFAGPVHGEVASGAVGWGRMLEPERVAEVGARLLIEARPEARAGAQSGRGLAGEHWVVTAGPTVEDLDPVRSLTNRSSGKMGFAIAGALMDRGARVTLVAGPVALETPMGAQRVDVRSALEMQSAIGAALGSGQEVADGLVMCAAVADYRPFATQATKIKRSEPELTLRLVQNPDLLAEIGRARGASKTYLLGFAVETKSGQALVEAAREKLRRKGCDAIVANAAADSIGRDDTRAVLVTETDVVELGAGAKHRVAATLAEFLASRRAGR